MIGLGLVWSLNRYSRKSQVTSRKSQVASYKLQVTSYKLQVTNGKYVGGEKFLKYLQANTFRS